jgi:muramoyltetrapeptide carboxypeptidase LdcA involved in peptidoglycan recycling
MATETAIKPGHAVSLARFRADAIEERARLRAEQRDVIVELIGRYNPEAVVCAGIPVGHTRPQWIIPHGGAITVDGTARRVVADYS